MISLLEQMGLKTLFIIGLKRGIIPEQGWVGILKITNTVNKSATYGH